jgi:hypothetical protein
MNELINKIANDFKQGFKIANLVATMYSKGILNDLNKLNGNKKNSNRS